MPFLSARDRNIELVFLVFWSALLLLALVDRFGGGAPEPWERGTPLALTSMVLGSAGRFVREDRVRWTLLGVSLVLMIVAIVLTFG